MIKKFPIFNIIIISCILLLLIKTFLTITIRNDDKIASVASATQDNSTIEENPNVPNYNEQYDSNNPSDNETETDENISKLSQSEIQMLKYLSNRHKQLLSWEKELVDKENLLHMINSSISKKLSELEKVKKEMNSLISEYKKTENKKISGVMKVYENMKPQEAAQIFEELNMDTLLSIIGQMQEVKLAPILAKMRTDKAREITVKLAGTRKIINLGEECICQ